MNDEVVCDLDSTPHEEATRCINPRRARPVRFAWSAQMNDVIGGWIVTRRGKPLSEHNGMDELRDIICETVEEGSARLIAVLLNDHEGRF